ncbi:MAG TPA: cytochrome c [Stellaceae bacterium]|nr:cytochrome c [Stellaceae bacterium]
MSIGRIVLGVCVLIAVAIGAFVAWTWRPALTPIEPPAASAFDAARIARGATLAAIGNCAPCHTTGGGRAFAGGLRIPTPFGTVYSTNITPDGESGIGTWSEAAFRRAMRDGVDRAGNYLYPAFPYDHFAKVSDSDLDAIYAFLMTRESVRAAALPNKLLFPLDIRLLVAGWQLLFLNDAPFQPAPANSEIWNRGAYLVDGIGHCGSCHTPRNLLGAEKAQQALAGGEAEGWDAPALNAASPAPVPWTQEALFDYLRHGREPAHGVAAGPMRRVVSDLSRAPDADVHAIAVYLAALAGGTEEQRRQKAEAAHAFAKRQVWPAVGSETSDNGDGEQIFAGACAVCHREGGTASVALALSTTINAPEPRNLIHIVLEGIAPEEGERGPIMPGFADILTDQQVAALVAYIRARFTERPAWSDVAARVRHIRSGK